MQESLDRAVGKSAGVLDFFQKAAENRVFEDVWHSGIKVYDLRAAGRSRRPENLGIAGTGENPDFGAGFDDCVIQRRLIKVSSGGAGGFPEFMPSRGHCPCSGRVAQKGHSLVEIAAGGNRPSHGS